MKMCCVAVMGLLLAGLSLGGCAGTAVPVSQPPPLAAPVQPVVAPVTAAPSPAVIATPSPVLVASTPAAPPVAQVTADALNAFLVNFAQSLPAASGTKQVQQAAIDAGVKAGVDAAVGAASGTPQGTAIVAGVSALALILSALLHKSNNTNTSAALNTAITALGNSTPSSK